MRDGERKREIETERRIYLKEYGMYQKEKSQTSERNGSRAILKIERPTLITVLSAFAVNRYQDFSVSGPLSSRFKFLRAEPSCLPWLTTPFPAPERAEHLYSRPSPDCDQQDSPSGKFKKQAQEE